MRKIIFYLCILFFISGNIFADVPYSLKRKAEKADFKLFKNETDLGTISYEMDELGNYKRTFNLQFAGQVITYKFAITVDENGLWKSMVIDVPGQKVDVIRKEKTAEFVVDGKTHHVPLTNEHIVYDSYGPIFESFTLQKYNRELGGKQKISRFFVPSSCADVTVEYIGQEIRKVKEETLHLHQYNIDVVGIMLHVFVDEAYNVYLINVPVQYASYVRNGYEDLLKPKQEDDMILDLTTTVKKETIMMPMRDEVELATDLYFPEGKEKPYPTILIRTPYKKEMLEIKGNFYASRGYVVAIQDCRGCFSSEGEWEPFVNEKNDGYDSVEWLAAQDWSSRKVGMIGGSYVGWTQLWTAVSKPPHLTTIIPNVAPPDPFYNIPYEYGVFYLFGSIWWAQIVESNATADMTGQKMKDINNLEYREKLASLPVIDLDKEIMGGENAYWRKWIENNVNNEYWEKSNFMEDLKDLDIPVFLQSGWFDGDGIGSKLNYSYLKQSKNKNQKLILGPWGHTDESSASLGNMKFGEKAAIDLQSLYLKWFDKWLKGIDNKIEEEPLVKVFVMHSNTWLEGDTYPLPQTKFTKFFLSSSNGANTGKGDGVLRDFSSNDDGKDFDTYVYNPGDPTPFPEFFTEKEEEESSTSENDATEDENSEPKNEVEETGKVIDTRQDILVYTTDILKEDVTIVGPVSAKIFAATSAKDTDWFVSLSDVDPENQDTKLMRGMIRARFRESTKEEKFLEENKVYAYDIDMWQTGITFKKGHRIRIEVASAIFPLFSRNLNTGGHNEMETEYVSATQKIYHTEEYPSHILLPVIEMDE